MDQQALPRDPDRVEPDHPEPCGAEPPPDWHAAVRRHRIPLERIAADALRRVGRRPQRHRVEDLVQEVYCRLLACERGFDPGSRRRSQVVAYLRRAVRSAAVDGVRVRCAAKRRREEPATPFPGEPADPALDPEERLLARDRRRRLLARLRAAAGAGPRAGRDAHLLALSLIGGWTSREIAASSGGRLRPSTIDAAVCRMRRRLAASGVRVPRRAGGARR